jgi:Polyphosphate kinase 2 (PPK2)
LRHDRGGSGLSSGRRAPSRLSRACDGSCCFHTAPAIGIFPPAEPIRKDSAHDCEADHQARPWLREALSGDGRCPLSPQGRRSRRLVTKDIWKERFQDIRTYERYLTRNGVVIRKFFLHVSKGEQKRRFLERLETPEKNWKVSANDIKERAFWNDYMQAYEDMIRNTSSPEAPWYVVPADNKWFTRIVVAAAVIEALDALDLRYPKVSKEKLKELAGAKQVLLGGKK